MESSSFLFQNVSVTEPQTHQDSMQVNSWVSYKVNCNSGNVTRRYSDFVWLSEVLNLSVPGCIIPSLPPKQTFGSLVNEFIQSRRRGLEKFLHRIVEHPELCISQYFKAFMEADETSFRQIMQNAQGLKPKRLSMLGDTIKSKWNAYVVTGKHLELEKDEGSVAVDNMLEYITKIDSIMTRLVSHAQSLTERSRKTSQSLHDFGQGFVSYGLAEGDALGQMLTKVGAVIDQLSVTAGDHASEEMQQLLEPLGEYSRSLESVKYSISVRSERRQQYVQELTQIDAHHIAYNKLLGQQGKEALATSKEKQIEESQAKADSYKLEFDLITVRLLKDFAAFQQRKCQEMKAILLGFVELQILYHRQSMATWEGVTPILANTDLTADAGKVWAEAAEAHATSQTHKQVSSFAPNPPQLPSNTSTINSASSSVGYNEIRSAGSSEEVARRPSFHNTTNNNANTATSVSTSTSAVAVAVAAECIIPIATESLTWCKQGAGAGGGTLESTGMEDIGEETSI